MDEFAVLVKGEDRRQLSRFTPSFQELLDQGYTEEGAVPAAPPSDPPVLPENSEEEDD